MAVSSRRPIGKPIAPPPLSAEEKQATAANDASPPRTARPILEEAATVAEAAAAPEVADGG
jgi:hypothetical protein